MHQKTLFKILAREGEEYETFYDDGAGHIRRRYFDFLTEKGFFWLWDRAKEKEWWPRFLNERYYAKECWDRMEDIDCDHVISTKFINPQRFHAALVEFLEAHGIGRKG